MIGIVTGAVAGLATITPASGFVGPAGALIIGLAGGAICYAMVGLVKRRFIIDNSLDVFAVHGVGGPRRAAHRDFRRRRAWRHWPCRGRGIESQLAIQIAGLVAVLIWSLVLSVVIAKAVQAFVGLRVSGEMEEQGLDLRTHGERGYNM